MIQKYLLTIVLVLFLLAGCDQAPGDSKDDATETAAESVVDSSADNAETPTPRPTLPAGGDTTILANGQLVAANPALPLSFKSSGRLLTIDVEAGDQVSTGDLIATLDDEALREVVSNAELAVAQAQNGLDQAQLTLDNLLGWEPDDMAVTVAEANLEAAEARYEKALTQDAAAGNSMTSARINLEQAERTLADAQKAYDNAWDEARDWEENYNEPICHPGQGGSIPCTGITWRQRIENDREGTTRGLQGAQDNLSLARANYSLTQAGLSDNNALDAQAAVVNAQQSLELAQTGPKESEIAAARLQVEQAELALQQSNFNLEKGLLALDNALLSAPWSGTVLSVDAAPATIVAAGTPIITLFDAKNLQFHTVNLSERDLSYIEPGQPAEISLKTYPSQIISGTVAHIVPQASGQVGDAATFTVVVDILETELELWSGMTGRADIQREAN